VLLAQLSDNHVDERGVIRDLLGTRIDSITRITTVKGAVRGNHVHELTSQWTYVLSGELLVANDRTQLLLGPGEMVMHAPNEPHAWKAVSDTDVLVFTRGPRRGESFEDDTARLAVPLLT
jgi:quercetin dioxygenase-like cupin family protein